MANAWFRMYAEFATDPKVQMLPENLQRRFVMLLCARCNGHVTLQDAEVTFLLRITAEEWRATKAEFVGRHFINDANEILNWDKRQFRSDSSTQRVAKYRENKKKQECNVTVTPQNRTDTEKKERISASPKKALPKYLPEFESLQKIFPNRLGKGEAFAVYLKTIKAGVPHETLVRGASQCAAYHRREGTKPKFIPRLSKWLNGRGWDDEYGSEKGANHTTKVKV
jgi:hypothetical protein